MEATATATAPVTKQIPISPNVQPAEVLRIYDLHRKNAPVIKLTTTKERKAKLDKFKDVILASQKEIEDAMHKDLRKAPVESDYTEIFGVVSEIRHTVSHLDEWTRPKEVDTPLMFVGSTSKVVFEPKGVTLIMSPWNYPFLLPLLQVVSAVAAGNTTIVKPSEFSPATSALLKVLLAKVFPENEVAVIEGDHSVASELLKLKFDHIHFTGAPAIGKVVMRAAAEHLTTVTLELGGKSPAFIDETADINAAVNKLTWGKFVNLGQTCIAPDYVLVHEKVKDEFIAKFKEKITKWFGEDPKQSPDLARMINNKHFNRVKSLIEDAVKEGAKVETGAVYDEAQNYIAPTVLSNVSLNSRVMQEEIFGPVLPVISFKNMDDAIALVNEKEKPLALYIFSGSSSKADYVLDRTSAGGTCINDNLAHILQPNLPFGGVNNSGIGKSGGIYGFKEFSNERAVLVSLTQPYSVVTPLWFPYGKLAQLTSKIIMKLF